MEQKRHSQGPHDFNGMPTVQPFVGGIHTAADLASLPTNVLFLQLAPAPPDDLPPAIPDLPPDILTKIDAVRTASTPRSAPASAGKA